MSATPVLLRRSSVGRNGGSRAPDWAAHMWSLVHLLITVLGYSLLSGRARTSMECVVATSICLVPLDGGLCATDYDRAAHRREASIIKDHCVGILSSSWACTVISGDCGRNICFVWLLLITDNARRIMIHMANLGLLHRLSDLFRSIPALLRGALLMFPCFCGSTSVFSFG